MQENLSFFFSRTPSNQRRMLSPVCSVNGNTSKSSTSLTARSCLSPLGFPVLGAYPFPTFAANQKKMQGN
eukprot:6286992-Prymnesium_polylepis.1